jgi:hypothetical protein
VARGRHTRAHAFVAASLGWMLDSFDVMLYAMVGAALINDPDLHLSFRPTDCSARSPSWPPRPAGSCSR